MTVRKGYRNSAILLASVAGLAALGAMASIAVSAEGPARGKPDSKTIGLVLTDWRYALVESPDYKECDGGLQPGEVAQLKATPGAIDRIKKDGGWFEARGPSGETSHFSPLTVPDPLPWHELVTKTGFGSNLDGTQDGHATKKTCKHEKFTSAEGEKVDNQSARVLGCVLGWRTGGQTAEFYASEIVAFPVNRHLIEITGVDDEMNDPAVEVNIYKGFDRLVRTGDNKFVPFLSQRIDPRYPKYTMKLAGKIVNGVLITDPVPEAIFPHSSERQMGDRRMRDMSLRLKLTPEGAEGMLTGYDDWQKINNWNNKRVTAELDKMSPPSMSRAFQRYADGYPDASGQCQFISAAYKVKAVRAMIVHPSADQQRIAVARN
jgi:hypothetical protein